MAADILAIPISTVASESTFSAGGRVIDERRTKLSEGSVEALICGGDWFRHKYNVKKKSKVIISYLDILSINIYSFLSSFFIYFNSIILSSILAATYLRVFIVLFFGS
jgi:hypothetical protein